MRTTTPNLFRRVLDSVAFRSQSLLGTRFGTASIESLCLDLISERGEASGTAIAREIAGRYRELAPVGRLHFFQSLLADSWLSDPERILKLAKKYHARPGAAELSELFSAVEPRRQELFRRINTGPSGTKVIVEMRSHLLALIPKHPDLEPIDSDLAHLLASWFNRGFLEIRRINWRTPALVLEKLIEYEAVHEIHGWPDLHRRLQRDRRCFAFFHAALPDDPLIFVEVALTRGVPNSIRPLIDDKTDPEDPAKADTAVFYSISNCFDGLRNIPFGAFLLGQVIQDLRDERLALRNFVTLSPIPLFRKWLLEQKDQKAILPEGVDLQAASVSSQPSEELRDALTQLCAQYLTSAREDGRPYDPVAAFHLRNGASIERINWMGDPSEKGMRQSLGMMANYAYRLPQIERNHELHVKEKRVPISEQVDGLLSSKLTAAKQTNSKQISSKQIRPQQAIVSSDD